jgi:hypothetical protein
LVVRVNEFYCTLHSGLPHGLDILITGVAHHGAVVVAGTPVVAETAVVGVDESSLELFISTTMSTPIATIARITPTMAPNPIPLFCVTCTVGAGAG